MARKKKNNPVEIDENFIKKGAEKISEDDVKKVAEKSDEIEDKFQSKGPLGRYIQDARLMLGLIADYLRGDYRKILWFTISASTFVLLYAWNPFDLIPDMIPFVGLVDDALVFFIALKLIEKDLFRYKTWKLGKIKKTP